MMTNAKSNKGSDHCQERNVQADSIWPRFSAAPEFRDDLSSFESNYEAEASVRRARFLSFRIACSQARHPEAKIERISVFGWERWNEEINGPTWGLQLRFHKRLESARSISSIPTEHVTRKLKTFFVSDLFINVTNSRTSFFWKKKSIKNWIF